MFPKKIVFFFFTEKVKNGSVPVVDVYIDLTMASRAAGILRKEMHLSCLQLGLSLLGTSHLFFSGSQVQILGHEVQPILATSSMLWQSQMTV